MPLRGEINDFVKSMTAIGGMFSKFGQNDARNQYYHAKIAEAAQKLKLQEAKDKATIANSNARLGIAKAGLDIRRQDALDRKSDRDLRRQAAKDVEAGRNSRAAAVEKGKNDRQQKALDAKDPLKGFNDPTATEDIHSSNVQAPGITGAYAPPASSQADEQAVSTGDDEGDEYSPTISAYGESDDEDNEDNEDNEQFRQEREDENTDNEEEDTKDPEDTEDMADGGVVGSGAGAGFSAGFQAMAKAGKGNNNNNSQNLAEGGETKGDDTSSKAVDDGDDYHPETRSYDQGPQSDADNTAAASKGARQMVREWEGRGEKSPVHAAVSGVADILREASGGPSAVPAGPSPGAPTAAPMAAPGASAVPAGAPAGAPAPPATASHPAVQKLMPYAMPWSDIKAADKAMGLPAGLSESDKNIYRLGAIHDFYLQKGDIKHAKENAASLLITLGERSQMYGKHAIQQFQAGNREAGMELLKRAYDQVPDGSQLDYDITPNGTIRAKAVDKDGNEQDLGEFGPQQALKFATGVASGSEFYKQITMLGSGHYAGMPPQKGTGAGGGRAPTVKDLQEGRTEISGAATDNADMKSIQFPKGHEKNLEGVANSIYQMPQNRQQGISPEQARQVANSLVNTSKNDDRPLRSSPNPDGSITFKDDTGRQFVVPHNAAMTALLVRRRLNEEGMAETQKQLEGSRKTYQQNQQALEDQGNSAYLNRRADERRAADEREASNIETESGRGRPTFLERAAGASNRFDEWAGKKYEDVKDRITHPHPTRPISDEEVRGQGGGNSEAAIRKYMEKPRSRKAVEDDE